MKKIPVSQGSPEWHKLRAGIPTASEFGRIITPAKGDLAAGRWTYAAELIAAQLGRKPSFTGNPDTEYGSALEGEARAWLNFAHKLNVRDIGFCLSDCGLYGASPDGLLEDGVTPVEIKCPDWHTFIRWKHDGGLPSDHKAQVHGEMFVTGADRCIFLAYSELENVKPLMVEVRRDAFTERLGEFVKTFLGELRKMQMDLLEDAPAFIAARDAERQTLIDKILKPAPAKPETLARTMNRMARESY